MSTNQEKENRDLWRKILPRPFTTQILKEKLCVYLESKRAPLEAQMNAGLLLSI
jgi:hypothetical protein